MFQNIRYEPISSFCKVFIEFLKIFLQIDKQELLWIKSFLKTFFNLKLSI